jgi:hypothetical protein
MTPDELAEFGSIVHRITALKPRLAVVHMSGDATESDSEELLRKPFTAAELIEKVNGALTVPAVGRISPPDH